MATPKYLPTPGNAGSQGLARLHEPQFESNDFDDYDLGGEWNPPELDEPASSPARRSIVAPASQSRRGLSSAMSDESELRLDAETSEAFEERTRQQKVEEVTDWLKSQLVSGKESVAFSKLTDQIRRKEAAQKFYSLLVLKKQNVVDVSQETDSDEITIVRGPRFETAAVC
jgi:cohesin complex subunit SCC1